MEKNLGQIKDAVFQAVANYHVASMGDDRRELENAEAEYLAMITLYGKEVVQLAVDYYNENVIRQAGLVAQINKLTE